MSNPVEDLLAVYNAAKEKSLRCPAVYVAKDLAPAAKKAAEEAGITDIEWHETCSPPRHDTAD